MKDNKKDDKKEEVVQIKVIKPVLPAIYSDGLINMNAKMITTKSAFVAIYKGNLKGRDIDQAWETAKAWKDSHR